MRPTLFYGISQVVIALGLSRATIYRLEKAGAFPARRQLTSNRVAWLAADIDQWAGERPSVSSAADKVSS